MHKRKAALPGSCSAGTEGLVLGAEEAEDGLADIEEAEDALDTEDGAGTLTDTP
jgi:hypothetical protein